MLKLTEAKLRKLIREALTKESYFDDYIKRGDKLQPVYFDNSADIEIDYNLIMYDCYDCGEENEIEIDSSLYKYKTSPEGEDIYYANCEKCGEDNKLDVSKIPQRYLHWAHNLGVIGKHVNLSVATGGRRDIDDPYLDPNRR